MRKALFEYELKMSNTHRADAYYKLVDLADRDGVRGSEEYRRMKQKRLEELED